MYDDFVWRGELDAFNKNENNTSGIQRSVVLLLTPAATTKKSEKKKILPHIPCA